MIVYISVHPSAIRRRTLTIYQMEALNTHFVCWLLS